MASRKMAYSTGTGTSRYFLKLKSGTFRGFYSSNMKSTASRLRVAYSKYLLQIQ